MRSWSRLATSSRAWVSRRSTSSTLATPRLVAGVQAALARVEPGLEELHQQPGDVDVVAQRVLDVVERERRVALAHVLRVGAQHRRLPPGQAGAEHQRVEPVDLVVAVPDRAQGVLEQLAGQGRDGLAVAQAELVDERRAAQALELVGPLVDDLDAHRGQHRQHLGQRQRPARSGTPSAGPRRGRRPSPRRATGRCPRRRRRRRSPRAGRGRRNRWRGGSPPCRPPGTSRGTGGPGARPTPRRTRS